MAEGGFFKRLSNLWRGFVGLWVSDMERDHPEIAYENSINSMIEKYGKLKSTTAAIMRRREDISDRLEKSKKELAQTLADLEAAMDTNQDDLAMVLIEKKNALESDINGMSAELESAKQDADDAKASLLSVRAEIDKLKAEKERMLAKFESAQARIKVQEQLDGLSVDAEVQALENVRSHIKNTISEASLNAELNQSDLNSRLRKLRVTTENATARKELEELKAARAQKAGNKQM